MEETPPRNGVNMIELQAQEIVDNEYVDCESCGLLTHEDDMVNYYNYNGYEYTYDCGAVYSECRWCNESQG